MAINFSQVKAITIPEGSVKKITDSTGNILWKAQTAEWHTIWEGSKTCRYRSSYSPEGMESNFAQTAIGTGYNPKLRITFTCNASNGSGKLYYYNNDGLLTSKPESPIVIEQVNDSKNKVYLVGSRVNENEGNGRTAEVVVALYKARDTENNRINFGLDSYISKFYTETYISANITLTVTKIEQYY